MATVPQYGMAGLVNILLLLLLLLLYSPKDDY